MIHNLPISSGPQVGFRPIEYTQDEEVSGQLEVCVELLSEGTLSLPVDVLLTTEDNTAVCKTCVYIVIVIIIV